jgi:anti-sigma-K factor RskA
MNKHPRDALPAFVLGSLDDDTTASITRHLAACPACRTDAEAFRACVDILFNAPATHTPALHVKQRLFERINSDAKSLRRMDRTGWLTPLRIVATLALVLTLVLALVTINARAQLDQQQHILAFITAPGTVAQPLSATPSSPNAVGTMYMHSGRNQAIMIVAGLRQPEAGWIYQCWFASPHTQVPVGTFSVGQDGSASLFLDTPSPPNSYSQFMVTIERAGGNQTPSDQIVLAASL